MYGYGRRRSGYGYQSPFVPIDPLAELIETEVEVEVVEDLVFGNDQDFGGGFDPF